MNKRQDFVFTSESVAAGHPDKLCDQISDAILDAILANEKNDPALARGAIEVLATTQHVTVAGEYRQCQPRVPLDCESIARGVIRELGYVDPAFQFDHENCKILNKLHSQDVQISEMVDAGGAGDQGLMFGYANRDTSPLLPMPIYAAHRLMAAIDALRSSGEMPYLRPDGKCQFSIRYASGRPVELTRLVVAVPHAEAVAKPAVKEELWARAVQPLVEELGLAFEPDLSGGGSNYILNGRGEWNVGGPHSDTGLTGRKVIVDTYGGWGRHGGGCFSGKDPTKVDRSAAYMMRYIAKHVVACGLAEECEIQVAYAIGFGEPMCLSVDTGGTGTIPDCELERILAALFDLRPREIIKSLDLFRPIYKKTATYGHFGRELPDFTWERLSRLGELRSAVGL